MVTRLLVAALLLVAGADGAHGQASGLCPAPGQAADTTGRVPDLVIRASAHAREVRFRSEPKIEVRLTGCSVLDTVRVLERRNLPEVVQPNVTYRDVFVAVEILGHLDVRCLLPGLTAPRGAEADPVRIRGGPVLARLCRPALRDSLPAAPRR